MVNTKILIVILSLSHKENNTKIAYSTKITEVFRIRIIKSKIIKRT